jgi:hypothetical protein
LGHFGKLIEPGDSVPVADECLRIICSALGDPDVGLGERLEAMRPEPPDSVLHSWRREAWLALAELMGDRMLDLSSEEPSGRVARAGLCLAHLQRRGGACPAYV